MTIGTSNWYIIRVIQTSIWVSSVRRTNKTPPFIYILLVPVVERDTKSSIHSGCPATTPRGGHQGSVPELEARTAAPERPAQLFPMHLLHLFNPDPQECLPGLLIPRPSAEVKEFP